MILVTGATGTVGGEVVRRLVADQAPVRVLVRTADRARLIPAGAEIVVGTFDDGDALARACRGVEGVFLGSFSDPRLLELQANVIAAARAAGVVRIARLSALSARPDSPHAFAREHGHGDRQVLDSGLGGIALQPTWFNQNCLTYFPKGVLRMPVGDGRVAFVDVRDIADVAIRVLSRPGWEGQSIELTGSEPLSHAEVALILGQATGRTFRFEDEPVAAFAARARANGMDESYLDVLLGLFARVRRDDSAVVRPGVRRVLGREPTAFHTFARDFAADLVKQL
ncbi:MAG: NAD(P)H-binding protein [Alphaproteobacteria bacterium]